MNIDENVMKILVALLRKWKVIVLFAVIGALIGYFYTANFTQLTYTSTVEFWLMPLIQAMSLLTVEQQPQAVQIRLVSVIQAK